MRGLPLLALRGVHSPGDLRDAAARTERLAAPAARATTAALATAGIVLALGAAA